MWPSPAKKMLLVGDFLGLPWIGKSLEDIYQSRMSFILFSDLKMLLIEISSTYELIVFRVETHGVSYHKYGHIIIL